MDLFIDWFVSRERRINRSDTFSGNHVILEVKVLIQVSYFKIIRKSANKSRIKC